VDFWGVVILSFSNILLAGATAPHLVATAESVFQRGGMIEILYNKKQPPTSGSHVRSRFRNRFIKL